jgi:FAD/FMN-containing dehydrogenase
MMSATVHKAIAGLEGELDGSIITPDHGAYDDARAVFYGGFDRRPAALIRPKGSADVVRVVNRAREAGLGLAVRSGGHSMAAHSVIDGAIVLDLSDMRGLDIDPQSRTAWAQTGLTAGEYTTATAEAGLATGFGDTGSVGIGGITLGGGVGYLSRKFGLTVDDVLAAEVVTPDGEVRLVDADNEPDLFWAIRGGGGNFGVVTRFKYRLHELTTVLGGMLVLPASPELVQAFAGLASEAPDELSLMFNVMTAPPMPFLPAEVHGTTIVMALMCYAGSVEDGERAIAPFRALATPLADMIRPMRYPEMYPPEQEGFHPVAVGRTMFVDEIGHDDAELIVDQVRLSSAQMAVANIRPLGGAVARVPADATAFAHRDRAVMVAIAAMDVSVEAAAAHEEWVGDLTAKLRNGDSAAYVNFIGDEGADRVRDAYPGDTWGRLRAVKRMYDPANMFRYNQNIPPAD